MGVRNSKFLSNYSDMEKGFDKAELKTIFEKFDSSGDGKLQKDEAFKFFAMYFKHKKMACSKEFMEDLFMRLDTDKSDTLEFAELLVKEKKLKLEVPEADFEFTKVFIAVDEKLTSDEFADMTTEYIEKNAENFSPEYFENPANDAANAEYQRMAYAFIEPVLASKNWTLGQFLETLQPHVCLEVDVTLVDACYNCALYPFLLTTCYGGTTFLLRELRRMRPWVFMCLGGTIPITPQTRAFVAWMQRQGGGTELLAHARKRGMNIVLSPLVFKGPGLQNAIKVATAHTWKCWDRDMSRVE